MDGVCIAAAVLVGWESVLQTGGIRSCRRKQEQVGPKKEGRKNKKVIYFYETVSPGSYPCVEGIVKRK